MKNYPVGADLDPRAPWNEKDITLICPECGSENIDDGDGLCVCCECGWEGYEEDFYRDEDYWEDFCSSYDR